MYVEYNPNPIARRVGDCAVRAIAKALNVDWENAYARIAANGYAMGDMPSSDSVWGSVLRQNGFRREAVPNTCPDCYTLAEFAHDHPRGTFVIETGEHAVCIQDGDWYDIWDSGCVVPIYYWYKEAE